MMPRGCGGLVGTESLSLSQFVAATSEADGDAVGSEPRQPIRANRGRGTTATQSCTGATVAVEPALAARPLLQRWLYPHPRNFILSSLGTTAARHPPALREKFLLPDPVRNAHLSTPSASPPRSLHPPFVRVMPPPLSPPPLIVSSPCSRRSCRSTDRDVRVGRSILTE